jgi:epoxide hydrolase-like predicted phosphatase
MREAIKAVIWDLGGVLVRTGDWNPRFKWEKHLGLERMELTDMVFNSPVAQAASIGQAQADDIWQWIGRELNLSAHELENLRTDYWSGDEVDYGLIDTIRSLKGDYQTALLSNAWPNLRPAIEERWKFKDAFDVMVISAEVGVVKPDPRIYQHTLSALEVEPAESVFIDDFIENVEGARAVGMRAIHFQHPDQALDELNQLLSDQVE